MSLFSSNDEEEEKRLTTQQIEELDKQEKAAALKVEQQFNGRSWGLCGVNMWKWWCSPPRCDSDHIQFHIFWLGWVGSIILVIVFASNFDYQTNTPPTIVYFISVGWGVGVIAWAFFQWTTVLNLRQKLAEVADNITLLRKTTQSITKSVSSANQIKLKLKDVNDVTVQTTNDLKKTFGTFLSKSIDIKKMSKNNDKLTKLLTIKYKEIEIELRNQLIISEMKVIEQVYNNIQFSDDEKGLTQNEFDEFVNRLPEQYKIKFNKINKNFRAYAGSDGILNRTELFQLMKQFAAQEAIPLT